MKKLTAIQEICDEIESLRILECKVQLDYEGVIYQCHDISLCLSVLYLVSLDDKVFLEGFHGENLSI